MVQARGAGERAEDWAFVHLHLEVLLQLWLSIHAFHRHLLLVQPQGQVLLPVVYHLREQPARGQPTRSLLRRLLLFLPH